jgi:hypothetical protein
MSKVQASYQMEVCRCFKVDMFIYITAQISYLKRLVQNY